MLSTNPTGFKARNASCRFALTLLVSLLLGLNASLAQVPQGDLLGPVPVTRIIDGDTVEVLLYGVEEGIRLIGVDTPETKHPTKGVEPFGPEASAFTESLLQDKDIWLEFDVQERDRYGRVLAYLYLPDSNGTWTFEGRRYTQVNALLAKQGLADVMTIAPNVRYAELYKTEVAVARQAGIGMWQGFVQTAQPPVTTPTPPAQQDTPSTPTLYDPAGPDRNCGDFSRQADAQAFFRASGGPDRDPHRLDRDRDGVVCESLP